VNRTRFIGLEARGLTIRRHPREWSSSPVSRRPDVVTRDGWPLARGAESRMPESNRREAPYRGALPPWRCGESGVAESRTRTSSVRTTKVTFHTTPHQRPDSNRAPSFWRRRCAQRSLALAPRRGIEPLSLGRQPSCDPSRITRHCSLSAASRTRPKRLRRAPPASGGTERWGWSTGIGPALRGPQPRAFTRWQRPP
jgi:hypothetical protein